MHAFAREPGRGVLADAACAHGRICARVVRHLLRCGGMNLKSATARVVAWRNRQAVRFGKLIARLPFWRDRTAARKRGMVRIAIYY